jgi:hypothetical protein
MTVTARFGLRHLSAKNFSDHLQGIDDATIGLAQVTGFDAADLEAVRLFCNENLLLIVIRCPKQNSRLLTGPGKPESAKGKTDRDGAIKLPIDGKLVEHRSDYDIMGIFEYVRGNPGQRYTPLPSSIPVIVGGKLKHARTPAFNAILAELNARVERKFQHGGNDDYRDLEGRALNGWSKKDIWTASFAAFTETGFVRYLPSMGHLKKFYADNRLPWRYGEKPAG